MEPFGDESAVNCEEVVAGSVVYKSSILRTMAGWTTLTGKRSCTLFHCFGQFEGGLVDVMDTLQRLISIFEKRPRILHLHEQRGGSSHCCVVRQFSLVSTSRSCWRLCRANIQGTMMWVNCVLQWPLRTKATCQTLWVCSLIFGKAKTDRRPTPRRVERCSQSRYCSAVS